MNATAQRFGLSCALSTPFLPDGNVDLPRLAAHVRSTLAAGCASVTLCGTTGEGASLGAGSRERMLAALRSDGVDMGRDVVFGIAASSTDEGLQRWFASVLERIADDGVHAILYHIPSVTAVPLSLELIGRLKERFAGTVQGVKDSSGDWGYARKLLAQHSELTILIGDERRLAEAVRMGASGAISGLANVVPELMLPLANEGRDDPRISALVEEVLKYSVMPAVKELVAHRTSDPAWRAVAPPLSQLTREEARRLTDAFDSIMRRAPG